MKRLYLDALLQGDEEGLEAIIGAAMDDPALSRAIAEVDLGFLEVEGIPTFQLVNEELLNELPDEDLLDLAALDDYLCQEALDILSSRHEDIQSSISELLPTLDVDKATNYFWQVVQGFNRTTDLTFTALLDWVLNAFVAGFYKVGALAYGAWLKSQQIDSEMWCIPIRQNESVRSWSREERDEFGRKVFESMYITLPLDDCYMLIQSRWGVDFTEIAEVVTGRSFSERLLREDEASIWIYNQIKRRFEKLLLFLFPAFMLCKDFKLEEDERLTDYDLSRSECRQFLDVIEGDAAVLSLISNATSGPLKIKVDIAKLSKLPTDSFDVPEFHNALRFYQDLEKEESGSLSHFQVAGKQHEMARGEIGTLFNWLGDTKINIEQDTTKQGVALPDEIKGKILQVSGPRK